MRKNYRDYESILNSLSLTHAISLILQWHNTLPDDKNLDESLSLDFIFMCFGIRKNEYSHTNFYDEIKKKVILAGNLENEKISNAESETSKSWFKWFFGSTSFK